MTTRFPNGITADVTGDVTGNVTGDVNGVTLGKITQTIARAGFTDGGAAIGTATLTTKIPVGAVVLSCHLTALTGFAGDTSAVVAIGDGTDADRYMTGTPSVFTTVATGLDLGVPSGARYHAVEKTVTVTVTSGADFTAVSAGSMTIEIVYLS